MMALVMVILVMIVMVLMTVMITMMIIYGGDNDHDDNSDGGVDNS